MFNCTVNIKARLYFSKIFFWRGISHSEWCFFFSLIVAGLLSGNNIAWQNQTEKSYRFMLMTKSQIIFSTFMPSLSPKNFMRIFFSFFTLILFCLAGFAQQNDKTLTDLTLSKDKIEGTLRFLASDELRGRQTPSPEQAIAARYLATQLKSYGIQAFPQYPDYYQPVPMMKETKPKEVSVNYNSKSFKFVDNTILLTGTNANHNAEAVFLNYGTAEDFRKADVKGKIVFVRCGDGKGQNPQSWYFQGEEKQKIAGEKGALALVELYSNPQLPWKLLVPYFTGNESKVGLDKPIGTFAHIWMHDPDSKEATFWQTAKKQKAQVAVEGIEQKKFTVYNLVGYLEGTDARLKNEYVVYSAHYDHIGVGKADAQGDTIYNGARDNAVGTVTVLSAAENMAKNKVKRSGLFILFTGEEKGLLGSEWFVDHSPVELKKIVYCFNSDNAGYNDTSIIMMMGLGRTTAEPMIRQAAEAYGLKAIDDPVPEQNLFDRSDNVSFAKKGIPAPTFSLGLKSMDEQVMKYYHQAADQPDNLDYDYLYKFFGSYVYACRLIANTDKTPFWTTGDKYYETGVKLYK
jgi:aminopeptidase YwaD